MTTAGEKTAFIAAAETAIDNAIAGVLESRTLAPTLREALEDENEYGQSLKGAVAAELETTVTVDE